MSYGEAKGGGGIHNWLGGEITLVNSTVSRNITMSNSFYGDGGPRGIAIQGLEGGVIPSVRRRTRGIELTRTHQVPVTVEPNDFGLGCAQEPELPLFSPPEDGYGAGDNKELSRASGDVTRAILVGENGPARNATLLGAALILKAGGRCPTIAEGVSLASESLDSGEPARILEHLKDLSKPRG